MTGSPFLNPVWLAEHNATPIPGVYRVFAIPYPHHGKPDREWKHHTLKAAGRRLGSVIAGKLCDRSDAQVFVIAPDGAIHNWYTANGKVRK